MIHFISDMPPAVQIFLAVAITGGITVGVALIFAAPLQRFRASHLEGDDPDAHLQIALGALLTSFAFIAAFMLGQFWSASIEARKAIVAENTSVAAVRAQIALFGTQAEPVAVALDEYERNVESKQWPAMRKGDAGQATVIYIEAAARLSESIGVAGAGTDPGSWQQLSTEVDTLIADGGERIAATPSALVPKLDTLMAILALLSLAMAAILAPTRRSVAIISLLAVSTSVAIVFSLLVQASNPYVGGSLAYLPTLFIPTP